MCLIYFAHGITTVDYLTAVCFPKMNLYLSHESTADYLAADCIPLMGFLAAMNYQLRITCHCSLLSPDEFSLCHESSTVDYLAAAFP